MMLQRFSWENSNVLFDSQSNLSLYCHGLFRFTVERKSDLFRHRFSAYFNLTRPDSVIVMESLPLQWESGHNCSAAESEQVLRFIAEAFRYRGFNAVIETAANRSEFESKFGGALTLFRSILETKLGSLADKRSREMNISDQERQTLWASMFHVALEKIGPL